MDTHNIYLTEYQLNQMTVFGCLHLERIVRLEDMSEEISKL